MESIVLCLVESLSQGNNKIDLNGSRYLVSVDGDNIDVYSSVCPHQGGRVCLKDGEYVCPLHNWKFASDGSCTNTKDENLYKLDSFVKEGFLNVSDQKMSDNDFFSGKEKLAGVDIRLLSHACVETKIQGLNILTDPWLDGPAFYGAWVQYPKFKVDIPVLDVDVILITHEHSDHFHPRSLKQFNRDVRIVFPSFPNARIEGVLNEMGFKNIVSLPFGQSLKLSDAVDVTFYEPLSVWNDSIVLLESPDANILNLNDAGLNFEIKKYLPRIDLILCQFNAGASSYPATWKNISDKDKEKFYIEAVDGKLEMLKQVMDLYGAKFLLPFASFFGLWAPEHQKYMDLAVFCPPRDIKKHLEGQPFEVLDLLPGDSWYGGESSFFRFRPENMIEKLYDKDFMMKSLSREYKKNGEKLIQETRRASELASVVDIKEYFSNFNYSPEISNCEDLSILLVAKGAQDIHFSIRVKNSKLSIEHLIAPSEYELLIEIPIDILSDIVLRNESWDEAHIGYWCDFDRNPDVYHVGFWRMIQAPYFLKGVAEYIQGDPAGFENQPLNKLLGQSELLSKLLGRYGLYCDTCTKREYETLKMALDFHGLSGKKRKELLNEAKFICGVRS